jgi:hypothetical protein
MLSAMRRNDCPRWTGICIRLTGLRWRGWHARLLDSEMIDDEAHVGVAVDQRGARVDIAREQDIDGEIVSDSCPQDAVEAWVVRRAL